MSLCLTFSFKGNGTFRDFKLLDRSLLIPVPNFTREDKRNRVQLWLDGWNSSFLTMLYQYYKQTDRGSPSL